MNVPLASIALLLALSTGPQAGIKDIAALHPALQVDSTTAAALFDKGYGDADHFKDLKKAADPFYRRANDSYMLLRPLSYVAYASGFKARKGYLTESEVKAKRDELSAMPAMDTIVVEGELITNPAYAKVSMDEGDKKRYTVPDVRVVLKVGDKVYQPRAHPGDLVAEFGERDYNQSVDGSRTVSKDVYDHSGHWVRTDRIQVPTTEIVHRHEAWITSPYQAEFDLFDPDGTPRIRHTDKEITLLLITGTLQKKFKYKMEDLGKLNTLKAHKSTVMDHFKIKA